ncbi:MAG: ferritin family protein [Spirochaetes bacterium]|nr:ferritin family protein [Spirochaetota bacterium]
MKINFSDALKIAIKGEIEGRELYKTISEKTEDSKAKEFFNFLSDEENKHFETLKQVAFEWSRNKEKFNLVDFEKLLTKNRLSAPIFSEEFKKNIKNKHFEISAISIAIKLEKDSFELYEKLSFEVENEDLKNLFKTLSKWEIGHYDLLNKELKELEENYYFENKFYPF